MRSAALLALMIAAGTAAAQDTCACSRNLERYIDLVTRDYAGFRDKVTSETQANYKKLVDSLQHVATSTVDKTACFRVLDSYRAFFRDKHLYLGGAFEPGADPAVPEGPPATTSWTAASLRSYFEERKSGSHLLEGVWTLDAYEVGIVFDAPTGIYQAVIIRSGNANWKEGMVKFTCPEPAELRTPIQYWRGDLGSFQTSAEFLSDHLLMQGVGTWCRTFPAPRIPMDERTFELTYGSEVQWKLLDDSTLYIKLGSCQLSNKAVLDSLVKANKVLLERIPNWIIDLRKNGGGSTDVFQSLLPYLYTKPFKEHGVSHWMSPGNTSVLRKWYQDSEKMLDPASARYMRKVIKAGETHPSTWHIGHGATTRFKKHDMPRRIAFLADKGTASSGEAFLEIARGISDKSVIFGANTGGYMDYGDVMPHNLGCDGLMPGVPTSRMNRIDHGLSYDLNGITPDVPIGEGTKDWIAFVQNYWHGR